MDVTESESQTQTAAEEQKLSIPAQQSEPETKSLLEPVEPIETLVSNPHLLTDEDIRLFHAGTHTRLYEKLGAHPIMIDGIHGTQFAVWAPNAAEVSVIGD